MPAHHPTGQATYWVVVGHILDLLIVISPGQLGQALRVEPPTVWEKLGSVLLGQLGTEGVDGDDEGAAIGFKLWGQCVGEERDRKGKEASSVFPPCQGQW